MASPANSVPDTQLGLTNDEIRTLRYHQQVALSQTGSSRAASQASSAGRLLLDPSSLAALSSYFDRLMYSIQQRWQAVSFAFITVASQSCYRMQSSLVAGYDADDSLQHSCIRKPRMLPDNNTTAPATSSTTRTLR